MADFYIQYEYGFAVFQLVLAMLGMGATLKLSDFNEILREPYAVICGTLIQLLLIPLLAYVFIRLLSLPAGVAIGIALIAAIPGGTSSNIFTHFARGNVALSISVTAITTLACLVTTPLLLELLVASYMPEDFVMPRAHIMKEIFFNLLLPLGVGMWVLHYFPVFARHLSQWCIRGSVLGLILIFVGASLAGRLDVEAFGLFNVVLVLLFVGLIVIVGWLAPRALGLSIADSTAVEMEVVVRSVNLGIMLKVAIFPELIGEQLQLGNMALFSLLLYGAIQMLLGLVLIPMRRSGLSKSITASLD